MRDKRRAALVEAKAIVVNGWTQGTMQTYDHRYCLVGALREGQARTRILPRSLFAFKAEPLARFVLAQLPTRIYAHDGRSAEDVLIRWNDHDYRRHEEVVALLDRAILALDKLPTERRKHGQDTARDRDAVRGRDRGTPRVLIER